eukprot:CAMPEP_0172893168 /NCGR_PEP_ID=MMETSP1075-20121228/147846_1 /TAXON_ID=2916 /ORGANISM="Ceratium fusus, Strain PA161109" /LENGTH=224 /DNA_ID=CAMNT_0013747979 /DNA_START=103 /DNA_END=774 /DNA_ORIENTATION=-
MAETPEPPVVVQTLDGKELSLELPGGAFAWQITNLVRENLGKPSVEIKLLEGVRVLNSGSHVLPGSALTAVQASCLPAFLKRKGLSSIWEITHDGSTALHLAAAQGDVSICMELLTHDDFTGVNAIDFLGNSVLHLAADSGLSTICEQLLARPDFSAVAAANRNGHTGLHLAALRGDAASCRAILARACTTGHDKLGLAKDVMGQTAADVASSTGHEQLASALR